MPSQVGKGEVDFKEIVRLFCWLEKKTLAFLSSLLFLSFFSFGTMNVTQRADALFAELIDGNIG